MKRHYMKPAIEVIALATEGMIATSDPNSGNHSGQGGSWHAPARGWDSNGWDGQDDEQSSDE